MVTSHYPYCLRLEPSGWILCTRFDSRPLVPRRRRALLELTRLLNEVKDARLKALIGRHDPPERAVAREIENELRNCCGRLRERHACMLSVEPILNEALAPRTSTSGPQNKCFRGVCEWVSFRLPVGQKQKSHFSFLVFTKKNSLSKKKHVVFLHEAIKGTASNKQHQNPS